MTPKLRFFLSGVATTVAVLAAAFGSGALLANSMSKSGKETRPIVRIETQGAVPVSRVALPDSSQPAPAAAAAERIAELHPAAGALQPATEVSQPAFAPHAVNDRPKSRRELREERRILRVQRRADRREKRHLLHVPQQPTDAETTIALEPESDAPFR